jgi:Na+-translocating ferredoxin:NAD+ oxidoreductase subunit G
MSLKKDILINAEVVKAENGHYVGYDKGGKISGTAYKVTQKGYGGTIEMIVGLDKRGRVLGVKILSMKETPGLGMRASERNFLKQFIGRSSKDALKAKKDVDAITGATITSQAVANGVKEAISRFNSSK